MHIEQLENLPEGKTELPSIVVIHKSGRSIEIDVKLHINLRKKEKKENKTEQKK